MPDCYQIKWVRNERKRNAYQLEIRFPRVKDSKGNIKTIDQNRLNKRKQLFKDLLFQKVKPFHDKHLEEQFVTKFDYKKEKTWYKSFKVHEVPMLELAELPKKPN